MSHLLSKVHAFVLKAAGTLSWLPPTLARLCLGFVFVQTGWGKLHDLPRVVLYFDSLGIPAPQLQAPFVAGVEFLGGLLVLAGLFTRVVSIPLAATMVVALVTAKWSDLHGLSDLFGTVEFLYLVCFGYLAAFGAGPISLDRVVVRLAGLSGASGGSGGTGTEAASPASFPARG